MTLAKLNNIGVDEAPGGIHKEPAFILCIGHVPGVATVGGIAVDQDTGNAQIGEHGLGQVGVGLANAFPFDEGGVGVLILHTVVVIVGDVIGDPLLDRHGFVVFRVDAGHNFHGFGTDLFKLVLGDDDVLVS